MSVRDLAANIRAVDSIAPQAVTGTVTGAYVKVYPAEALAVLLNVGAITTLNANDKLTVTLLGSNDSAGAGAVALAAADYYALTDETYSAEVAASTADPKVPTTWNGVLDNLTVANRVYQMGIMNTENYQYMAVVVTGAGNPSALLAAMIVKGVMAQSPS